MAVPCFDLLDRHVIGGHADDVALVAGATTWTYARLLEEVSAFGGVLLHCGVTASDQVDVALPAATEEEVVVVLACARIGARHRFGGSGAGATVLVTAGDRALTADAQADVVVVRQLPGRARELREGQEYDWDVVMRAGRTDPAACLEGATLVPDDRVRGWVEALHVGGTARVDG